MSWVVDTCVLLDIAVADPVFSMRSARMLDRLRPDGLTACHITLVEIAPVLGGKLAHVRQFCHGLGIPSEDVWTPDDTQAAIRAWHAYVSAKRAGLAAKRPIADILIGAFASRRRGLVTRNAADFTPWFERLNCVDPAQ